MSLSGPDALRSLDEALRDIRREEDEIAKRLARSAEMITKMREQEGELLSQLAQVRLDPATQKRTRRPDWRRRAQGARHAQGARIRAGRVGAKARGARRATSPAADRRARHAAGRGGAPQRRTATRSPTKCARSCSPIPPSRRSCAHCPGARGHRGESRCARRQQAEADREEKGKPYRDDPLFMYLWEGGYGTKSYRANNLVAWLDGH